MPRFLLLFAFFPNYLFAQSLSGTETSVGYVNDITLSEKGTFRGFAFGDPRKKVKKNEPLHLSSENDSTLLYTYSTQQHDSVDVVYYFDEKGLAKSFVIAFVLNDDAEEASLTARFADYYTSKFGPFATKDLGGKVWKSPFGYQVEMRLIQDESGTGTEIIYSPL